MQLSRIGIRKCVGDRRLMAWLIVEIAVDIGFVPVCGCVGVWVCGCGRESTDTIKVDLLILCEYQVTWHCALLCTSSSTVLPYL